MIGHIINWSYHLEDPSFGWVRYIIIIQIIMAQLATINIIVIASHHHISLLIMGLVILQLNGLAYHLALLFQHHMASYKSISLAQHLQVINLFMQLKISYYRSIIIAQQVKTTYLMKKCYVSVLISVVKLSFNKMNTG